MKKILILAIAMLSYSAVSAQLVAKLQLKEPIDGICNMDEVYALFPSFDGQDQAECAVSKEELEKKLNEIQFLKDNPKFKGEGMMGMIINCRGEVVQCKIDNKTGNAELDAQIEAVFKETMTDWKAGKLNGKKVDTSRLWSFKIKKGVLTLN